MSDQATARTGPDGVTRISFGHETIQMGYRNFAKLMRAMQSGHTITLDDEVCGNIAACPSRTGDSMEIKQTIWTSSVKCMSIPLKSVPDLLRHA